MGYKVNKAELLEMYRQGKKIDMDFWHLVEGFGGQKIVTGKPIV